ncbi:hypothetical protein Pmani_019250 [Petrolisthes manimaculis]|uniref:Uncharacterized protein n=1 Tax=Petrolisthes manimaculis TaxID=1843537 RepID=A0AAE1PJZ3_9EUCA|nr:hypothetical protein Pmani_019250 [Petrolisthes manimaculis]
MEGRGEGKERERRWKGEERERRGREDGREGRGDEEKMEGKGEATKRRWKGEERERKGGRKLEREVQPNHEVKDIVLVCIYALSEGVSSGVNNTTIVPFPLIPLTSSSLLDL